MPGRPGVSSSATTGAGQATPSAAVSASTNTSAAPASAAIAASCAAVALGASGASAAPARSVPTKSATYAMLEAAHTATTPPGPMPRCCRPAA